MKANGWDDARFEGCNQEDTLTGDYDAKYLASRWKQSMADVMYVLRNVGDITKYSQKENNTEGKKMKVYCKDCINYREHYEDGYNEWCKKADKIEVKINGTHRDPPRIWETVTGPETKNMNNDCKDYEAKNT